MTYMVREGEALRAQGKEESSTIVEGVTGWSAIPLMRHMYVDPGLQPTLMHGGLLPSGFGPVIFMTGASAALEDSPWWSSIGHNPYETLRIHGTQRRLVESLSHLWNSSAVTSAGREANFAAVTRVLQLLATRQTEAEMEDGPALEEFSLFSLDVDPAASQDWTIRRYSVSKQPTVGTPVFDEDDFDV